jgi:hypothetical protein
MHSDHRLGAGLLRVSECRDHRYTIFVLRARLGGAAKLTRFSRAMADLQLGKSVAVIPVRRKRR